MTKVKMPEPTILKRIMQDGYWYGDIFGHTRQQMKSYANDRVREALEGAIDLVTIQGGSVEIEAAIRALIPEQEDV